jgi:hypothetical protein
MIFTEAAKKKSTKPKPGVVLEDDDAAVPFKGAAPAFAKKKAAKAKALGYLKATKSLSDLA